MSEMLTRWSELASPRGEETDHLEGASHKARGDIVARRRGDDAQLNRISRVSRNADGQIGPPRERGDAVPQTGNQSLRTNLEGPAPEGGVDRIGKYPDGDTGA